MITSRTLALTAILLLNLLTYGQVSYDFNFMKSILVSLKEDGKEEKKYKKLILTNTANQDYFAEIMRTKDSLELVIIDVKSLKRHKFVASQKSTADSTYKFVYKISHNILIPNNQVAFRYLLTQNESKDKDTVTQTIIYYKNNRLKKKNKPAISCRLIFSTKGLPNWSLLKTYVYPLNNKLLSELKNYGEIIEHQHIDYKHHYNQTETLGETIPIDLHLQAPADLKFPPAYVQIIFR